MASEGVVCETTPCQMAPATVASAYQTLAHAVSDDATVHVHCARDPFEVVHQAALLNDNDFFRTEALPPVLLNPVDKVHNANWLYGGTRTSPVEDAGYKPGKFDVFGKRRHQRQLIGAAFLEASTVNPVPVLLYELRDAEDRLNIVAHVFAAPLAELEAQLGDPDTAATPFEAAVAGSSSLAEHRRLARLATFELMRAGGLAALPGFLLNDDYHLVRPGLVSMLRLRSPETDLELEILERVCMTALHHHLHGLAGENALGPSGIVREDQRLVGDRFLTVFDRCDDEFDYLNSLTEEQAGNGFHSQERDYKTARWADACKLARRQVVVPLAAALLSHGESGVSVDMEAIAKVANAASKFALEEASQMARAADARWLKRNDKNTLHNMTELLGMCPGASRLRHMAPNCIGEQFLMQMNSQLFDGVIEAEMASREIDFWGEDDDDPGVFHGNATNAMERVAKRVDEPNAMLLFRLRGGQTIDSIKLVSSCVYAAKIRLGEAARLLTFPWVVPAATNNSFDNPRGLVTIEQPRVARDKLRVTEAVRLQFGVKPKPAASPEDLMAFKREMNQKLQSLSSEVVALKNEIAARNAAAPAPAAAPTHVESCATTKRLREASEVLMRMMRKRGIAALSVS